MKRMAPSISTIITNYDDEFDVLYSRKKTKNPTYGDEDDNGIVTLRRISDDEVMGVIIYDFKKRFHDGELDISLLPFPLDMDSPIISQLIE